MRQGGFSHDQSVAPRERGVERPDASKSLLDLLNTLKPLCEDFPPIDDPPPDPVNF